MYFFAPSYFSVRFLRTGTSYNQSMSMDSGNLTLIQYYYLIHYANSDFANSLGIAFYSYFLRPIQDSTCHVSYFLSVSQNSLFFIPLPFYSVHCSKVCVCVMFFHDYDFFFAEILQSLYCVLRASCQEAHDTNL